MADLAFILMMGAVASILVLTIAPLSLVYLAAFVTLTPILGIALWRGGMLFLEAAIDVVGALRLGTRGVSESAPPVVESSPEVLPALPAGEPEPDDEPSAAGSVLDAASVPELTAEPRPDSPSDSGEIEPGVKEDA